MDVTEAERAFVLLRDEQTQKLGLRVARGLDESMLASEEFRMGRRVVERVVTDRRPVLTTSMQEHPRSGGPYGAMASYGQSILCVPVLLKADVMGVLYADKNTVAGPFGARDRDLVTAFAVQVAAAIERAQLVEESGRRLRELAILQNVFGSIPSGIVTTDMQDRVTTANGAAERLLGLRAAELIGRPIADAVAGTDLASLLERVKRTGEPLLANEVQARRAEGEPARISVSMAPLRDTSTGTRLGVALVIEDLTERSRVAVRRPRKDANHQVVAPA